MGKVPFSICVCSLLILVSLGCEDTSDLIQPEQVDRWEVIGPSKGLISDDVLALFEDSNEDIWIGTFDGISYYKEGEFINFDQSDGLADIGILSISEYEGIPTVGTFDGIALFNGNGWISYDKSFVGANDFVVYALLNDSQGRLWISHAGYGFWIIEDFVFQPIYQDNACLQCNFVNDFLEDSNGVIWSATDGGLKKHSSPENYTLYTSANGLHGDLPSSLYEDSKGNIWIGYRDSEVVTRYDGNTFVPVFLGNDAFIDFNIEVTGIGEDLEGNMWFSTFGLGAISTDGLTYQSFYKDNSDIPNNISSEVIVDSRGDIWIATLSGIFKYTSL